jgi:REP element-mobilizing transposase RayT
MARAPRYLPPGGYYHVTSRGNNKQAIYLDDADRAIFLELLARFSRREGWPAIAYCLMTNHYHLIVHLPEGGLSSGIQLLNGGFARRFNRRHGRTDHLFRQRFTCAQIQSEAHLVEACRYVVLNPVRAGLCNKPEHWLWSSYRSSAGLALAEPFLQESTLLKLFGRTPVDARRAYRDFVAQGLFQESDTARAV